jgi:hypothetical protein
MFSMSCVCSSHCIISSSYFLWGSILILFRASMSLCYCISSFLLTSPNITLLSDWRSTKAMKHLSLLCLRVRRIVLVSARSILVLLIWSSLLPERMPTCYSYDLCLILVLRMSFFKNWIWFPSISILSNWSSNSSWMYVFESYWSLKSCAIYARYPTLYLFSSWSILLLWNLEFTVFICLVWILSHPPYILSAIRVALSIALSYSICFLTCSLLIPILSVLFSPVLPAVAAKFSD